MRYLDPMPKNVGVRSGECVGGSVEILKIIREKYIVPLPRITKHRQALMMWSGT